MDWTFDTRIQPVPTGYAPTLKGRRSTHPLLQARDTVLQLTGRRCDFCGLGADAAPLVEYMETGSGLYCHERCAAADAILDNLRSERM